MRLHITGLKPDKEGECNHRGNKIECLTTVKVLGSGGSEIPLELIEADIECGGWDAEAADSVATAASLLANATDTELFAIIAVLVPKRHDGANWADPVTHEQIDFPLPRRLKWHRK